MDCGATWSIRRKRRGPKSKRQSSRFASAVLQAKSSLRGIAGNRQKNKGLITGRFHRSVQGWLRQNHPAKPFSRGMSLILVADGLWFFFQNVRYTCFIVLVRSVKERIARLRGLVLLPGEETETNWRSAFSQSLAKQEVKQIKAIVADGSHGLTTIARESDWRYQRCHFHLLKDLQAVCGRRRGKTSWLRQGAFHLVRANLNSPDERKANLLKQQLIRLIAHPDCPKTVRKKIGGFLAHYQKFRTCYDYPELNIPSTSNSAEAVGRLVRDEMSRMRGLRTPESLRYWLNIILRKNKTVKCEPKNPQNY